MNNEKITQKIGNDATFKVNIHLNGYPCMKISRLGTCNIIVLFTKLNTGIILHYSDESYNALVGCIQNFDESIFETYNGELTLINK